MYSPTPFLRVGEKSLLPTITNDLRGVLGPCVLTLWNGNKCLQRKDKTRISGFSEKSLWS